MIEIRVPAVGESIAEVRVGRWLKRPGETVAKDEDLVELETDKASVTVPAPESGTLGEILKPEGQPAKIGETLARLEPAGGREQAAPERRRETDAPEPPPAPTQPRPAFIGEREEAEPAAPRRTRDGRTPRSPSEVRHGGAPAPPGNGSKGRRTFVAEAAAPPDAAPAPAERTSSPAPAGERRDESVPMSPLRRAAARRLLEAQQTAAAVTTFNEIDLGELQEARERHRARFEERHGVRLGLMSFFVKAVVDALRRSPELNAEIRDERIVYHRYYDIGIAVAGPKGLVVPVLRGADRLGFAEIERGIADLAARAQGNRIRPEDLEGGTFTITNGGVFGSLLSTPMLNPPQSGILGMHAVQPRPVARDGQVVVRPMMFTALTYDHRLVDGREAVAFLKRVKETIEDPVRLLLQI